MRKAFVQRTHISTELPFLHATVGGWEEANKLHFFFVPEVQSTETEAKKKESPKKGPIPLQSNLMIIGTINYRGGGKVAQFPNCPISHLTKQLLLGITMCRFYYSPEKIFPINRVGLY